MSAKRRPKNDIQVLRARARRTAQVRFPDGTCYEAPVGTPLEAFIAAAVPGGPAPTVAALADGELWELAHPVSRDMAVTPISMDTGDGLRIYRRSLCFLLVVAARECFPQARILIDHSLTLGGLFCRVMNREPFSADELAQIEARMWEIAAADAPIDRQEVPLAQAVEHFQQQGDEDKVRLLAYRQKDSLPLYTLRGVYGYFYGYMVPSTGYLHRFTLRPYPPGFILGFPVRYQPGKLPSHHRFPKLAAVFQRYGEWLEAMGIADVAALNQAVEAGRIREVALISEALQEGHVAEIARGISSRRDRLQLVLIAGPSSSGKTTFAKRLAIQLLAMGIRPLALSLDDYFLSRQETPRTADGQYDYESLQALDLACFNQQLQELMAGREVTLPRYDFVTGQRQQGPTVALGPRHMVLAEGIHGLNPELVTAIPSEAIYRIYVSALTQLNLDAHNRIPTTDNRLLRRLVRDARERGISAQQTIYRWEQVVQGEFQNIFPYQENADIMFNSALAYELAVIKPLAEPLLRQIDPGTMAYAESRRLLAFLEWFLPCGPELVPDNSILREFIGGSVLKDFEARI